ncbi:Na+/H+ antiporter subunit A [Skermania sp. ID1734]|uniref:Na+/H+ antiporter subunit A n=1 Tax=Skermania sp. ID1734 TaxID=2597516 RepID=UPI00117C9FD4|nr:Na+/H+ antiporter subunit A [Skermania sp. ID1734]TSD99416.1 Na+/H+ antiporter subunit A [Skermania sp. ID1734]
MLAILLALGATALLAPLCVRALGRNAFVLLAAVPLGCLAWVGWHWNRRSAETLDWIPGLHLSISLRFDTLAAIMCALVLGVGALVLLYCSRYFTDDEPRLGLFAAELVGFAAAMFGLVTSDNLLLLYTFWELTTVLSFLLVGHYAERATSRRAATQALLVTTAGGLAMLVGIIVLAQAGGSYQISVLLANPPHGAAAVVGVALILAGAISKSSIVPMHFWLPGAMAAPTPVSAYLHAAAMVKAGIYLIARLAPGFAENPAWHVTIIPLGLVTMVLGGWRAFGAHDLKLVLAFGTVSQLGFMAVLVGIGTQAAALAGMAMLLAHALFKAALFMTVGIIDHTTGTRDIRKLAGLGRRLPVLAVVAALAAASMAGLPPFLGFVGKEAAFTAIADAPTLASWVQIVTLAAVVLGSVLTLAYSLRFWVGAFGSKELTEPSPAVARMHAPGALFLAPPALLAVSGLAAGPAAAAVGNLLEPYARTLPGAATLHLLLWHGFGLALALTGVVVAGGVVMYAGHRIVDRLRPRKALLGNADRAYDAALRMMDRLSIEMTSATQRGSLPLTQATILTTMAVLPTVLLALGATAQLHARLWDSPWQPAIAAVMIAAALAATIMRNRLASVLLVGVTGYGCGVLFAVHGAPDLALTQFLVETLTLVIFVLVLRKLPAEIEDARVAAFRLPRAALAIVVGAVVAVIGAFASNARRSAPISAQMPDAAYHLGNGRNVVNVLLVDIRAWDTLGEISVLLVAATGVASLVFRHRRFGTAPRVSDVPSFQPSAEVTWLRGGELIDPRHRSLVLEVTTRLVFPTIMVLSFYFFFAGHNAPGGGFAGGLTAGLALVLRYLAGGRYELGEALPIDAGHILGVGLAFAAGTAAMSILVGAPVLSSATIEFTLPVIGHAKLVTAVFFDVGVYLIVVGLVLDVLRSLGARLDSSAEAQVLVGARR